MKLLLSVLLLFICIKKSDLHEQVVYQSNTKATIIKHTQKKIEIAKKISYLAVSRGFYLSVIVGSDSISFTNNRQVDSVVVYAIPHGEKETLTNLINDIDETSLPNLEAPSTKHQFDGAAIAALEVTTANNSYKTIAFDHGNPPVSIKSLIEKMLSIKSMIEKQ
jgi:hypothetical protein